MTNSCYSSTPTLICESGKLGVSKRFQQGDPTTMSMPPSVSEKEHVHTFFEAKVMFSSLQFHQSVLWDMIEGFTEEIKLAGGIGCFEKRMSLFSSSFIGRPFFNATSGRHFYFHQETLASNRLCGFETASSSTSFSDLDVQKIESVTLSELNAYVVNPIPQETEFLCKTKGLRVASPRCSSEQQPMRVWSKC
ncbi:BnaC03g36230D [Brassica napus]|uniref:BnaC03g36230D protein n=1 Tax=Brassica napus TaxID=3708 RepID=A0A078F0E3_BRANA|nr:BnaC03g36230D [Brassica napus]